jgi:putative membrane protein
MGSPTGTVTPSLTAVDRSPARTAARVLAIVTFVVAFGVLDGPADSGFAAHMTQHMLLMVVLAPALVIGWGPRRSLPGTARLSFALAAVVGQAAALIVWHVPAVFEAAEAHTLLHACEHLTLLATAAAAWWVILASPLGAPERFAACVGAAAPMLLLGALLTLANAPWYSSHATSASRALVDQQAGGAIMWGPAGVAYVVAASWIVAQAIVRDERFAPPRPE